MDTISEITYNDNAIIILKDKKNIIWFSAYDICKILGYRRARDIIINLVNKKHMNYLKNIFEDYKLYPNAQPNSIYLNESGLYTLLIRSKKPNAEKFFLWVVEEVLPSIRKNGIYSANKEQQRKIQKLNKIIDKKDEELLQKNNELKQEKL